MAHHPTYPKKVKTVGYRRSAAQLVSFLEIRVNYENCIKGVSGQGILFTYSGHGITFDGDAIAVIFNFFILAYRSCGLSH